jgi:hypothetical protein
MIELTDKQLEILTKLSELEEAVGKIYEVYAELFPDYRQFWLGLSDEEKQHSRWVHSLRSDTIHGFTKFNVDRFNIFAINTFISYLNDELGKAVRRERSLINALSITKYIEESLIEHKYFEILVDDSPKMKQVLTSLGLATQNHAEKVREALSNYMKTSHP